MGRKKTEIDEQEIDEIINLFVKTRLNGAASNLTYNSVKNFNLEIASNDNYIRENGEKFTLYKYNFWAGKYNGVDSYGKQRIDAIKKKHEVKVVGEVFSPDIQDIVALVDKLHNKPEELKRRLSNLFTRKIKENDMLEKRLKVEIEQKENLRRRLEIMDTACTNLIFQSQSPNNSLNDMFRLSKEQDCIVYNEFVSIFNSDEARINKMIDLAASMATTKDKINNVIQMPKKTDNPKYSGL